MCFLALKFSASSGAIPGLIVASGLGARDVAGAVLDK